MLNKVMLIGRLCADPDIRYMPQGEPTVTVQLATNRRWKDKSGDKKEDAEFHRVVFFSGLADIVKQYLTKGALIYVEGRLKTRKWQGQDGQERYTTEIIASDLKMLSGKPGDTAPATANSQAPATDDFDDDIPF